jgi:histidyl-tRNA synthetase
MAGAPLLLDHLSAPDAEHFEAVKSLLDAAEVRYDVDPTLVRGLDYYTRTVFELTSDALGAQSGVGGGGRYDTLVETLGGPPTPAMGWAAGIERIMLVAGDDDPAPPLPPVDLFVAFASAAVRRRAFALVCAARSAGLSAQMELAGRSMKRQLSEADKLRARYVAIVDDPGTVVKDMQTGTQQDLATDAVVHHVLRAMRDVA